MPDVISRKQARETIVELALRDEEFRVSLLANPKSALERALGRTLDDNLQVLLLEETDDIMYIVLPKETGSIGPVLSESELEKIAGGCFRLGSTNLFSSW